MSRKPFKQTYGLPEEEYDRLYGSSSKQKPIRTATKRKVLIPWWMATILVLASLYAVGHAFQSQMSEVPSETSTQTQTNIPESTDRKEPTTKPNPPSPGVQAPTPAPVTHPQIISVPIPTIQVPSFEAPSYTPPDYSNIVQPKTKYCKPIYNSNQADCVNYPKPGYSPVYY